MSLLPMDTGHLKYGSVGCKSVYLDRDAFCVCTGVCPSVHVHVSIRICTILYVGVERTSASKSVWLFGVCLCSLESASCIWECSWVKKRNSGPCPVQGFYQPCYIPSRFYSTSSFASVYFVPVSSLRLGSVLMLLLGYQSPRAEASSGCWSPSSAGQSFLRCGSLAI